MSLRVQGLSKSFTQGNNHISVVKKLNLNVSEGDIVAIVGPSGSGKSTLLSLLAGIEEPDSGEVLIDNTNLYALSKSDRVVFRGKKIGIIFQQFHLMSHLSAIENVMLPLEIAADPNPEPAARELLTQVGLSDRLHHRPQALSGGECQRVAIARALVIGPRVLLADEPSGSLDEKTGKMVIDLLFDTLRARKVTSLLVTHSHELAQRCDRVLEMHGGILR